MFVCIRSTQLKSLTSAPVWGVEAQQLDEESVHVELALEGLEDDVEHAVGVQVEEADDGLDHLQNMGNLKIPQRKKLRSNSLSPS